MNNLVVFPLYLILFYLIGLVLKNRNYLLDKTKISKHKTFVSNKQVPISGGILFYTLIILFFNGFDITDKIFLFYIYLLVFYLTQIF